MGDQFALLEAQVIMAVLAKRYDFSIVEEHEIGLTTGATIHSTGGIYVKVTLNPKHLKVKPKP